jgi:hypothetical protein
MKKISVVFALLLMMGFASGVTAASLNWDSVPAGALTTSPNTRISAAYEFGNFTGAFTHTWNYSSLGTIPFHSVAHLIELFDEHIFISSIILDGNAMEWDDPNSRWFGSSAVSLNHILQLSGTVNAQGQGYLLSAAEAPIPAAIWLFGSALAGLLGISTRKTGTKALTA